MFADAIEAILADYCTPADVRAVEGGASANALTRALEEAGFFDLMAPEDTGGGGAGWADLFAIARLAGMKALPIPLLQTMAARAIVSPGQALPTGLITFAPGLSRSDDAWQAARLPFARTTTHVMGMHGGALLVLPMARATLSSPGIYASLAADGRWPADAAVRIETPVPQAQFEAIAALLHAGLLAGAMKRCFDLTMNYANERVQFGKPIGRFQVIQHQLAVLSEQVAAAGVAAEHGFGTSMALPPVLACAVAKSRTSEAAQVAATIAHAIHGAIGVTEEYDLQLHTRRLHEWRMAHGSDSYWNLQIGRAFLDSSVALSADFARRLA